MPEAPSKNLYETILGVSPEITDPNHYELLGIPLLSADEQLIREAAVTQNAKLMRWQNNNELHKRVRAMMLEVANARSVLLDAAEKSAYDESLEFHRPVAEIKDDAVEADPGDAEEILDDGFVEIEALPPRVPRRGRVRKRSKPRRRKNRQKPVANPESDRRRLSKSPVGPRIADGFIRILVGACILALPLYVLWVVVSALVTDFSALKPPYGL